MPPLNWPLSGDFPQLSMLSTITHLGGFLLCAVPGQGYVTFSTAGACLEVCQCCQRPTKGKSFHLINCSENAISISSFLWTIFLSLLTIYQRTRVLIDHELLKWPSLSSAEEFLITAIGFCFVTLQDFFLPKVLRSTFKDSSFVSSSWEICLHWNSRNTFEVHSFSCPVSIFAY